MNLSPILLSERRSLLTASLLLLAAFTVTPAHGQQKHALTKERIISLLKSYVLPERVAELARRYGIDFEVTAAAEREIRAAGGNQALIEALRELAPHRETVPATERREAATPPPRETAAPVAPPAPGTVRVNPKDGQKYVWIPPGTFQMGCSPGDNECSDRERPLHQVTITKGFWLGQTEATVGAYKRFASETARGMPPERYFLGRPLDSGWMNEGMPIFSVTWDEAHDYCAWAGGRLPTEAEWEYAARGVSAEARYGALDDIAWYADNSGRDRIDSTRISQTERANYERRLFDNLDGIRQAAQKRANTFGLYDMLGNVWEWVNDWYDANYYQNSPATDPTGPASGRFRVLRGGSWYYDPRYVRVSVRSGGNPDYRQIDWGCRCLWEVSIP